MQVIHFYLVSIFLSCVKLSLGALSGGVITAHSPIATLGVGGTSMQKNRSSHAFISFRDHHITMNNLSMKSNNLSLNSNNYSTTAISAVNKKNYSDPYASENYNSQLENPFKDNPGKPGSTSFNLYSATVNVVKAVFNTLKSKQEDIMATGLGIADDISLTVTGSMSILYFLKINLDRLGKVFYYLFDSKHMMERDKCRESFINNVQSLIDNIDEVTQLENPLIDQYNNIDLDTVVSNLRDLLQNYKVGDYHYRDIMVNVQLMKSMRLINHTDSPLLQKLIKSISDEFLEEAKKRQFEIDGVLIAKSHAEAIRKMMPAIFSLFLNHVELLNILLTRELHKEDTKIVIYASNLLKNIMATFIKRFKNFGELTDQETKDIEILRQLIEALDTGETEQTEGVQEDTQAPRESRIDPTSLLPLTEQAIGAVLNLTGKKGLKSWKDHNVFKFKNFQENQDNEYYMNLLTTNADTSYMLVGEIEESFLDEIDYIKSANGGSDEVFFL